MEDDLAEWFENAPCGYLTLDDHGLVVRVNATFLKWIETSKAHVAGRHFSELLTLPGKIFYETHFSPLLRMQGFFNEVALDIQRADKPPLPVLVNARARAPQRPTGDGAIWISVFNASDRRRYERELVDARNAAETATEALRELSANLEKEIARQVQERLKAEEQVKQLQKMEAIGQLTGGVAHDFNNLLTVILGGLEGIGRQLEPLSAVTDTAKLERYRDMAVQGATRAATLTARLLAFSRQQTLKPAPIRLDRVVLGVADLLCRTLGETIEWESVSGAGLWTVYADSSELEHALINLAVNARDAMPDGGKLTIETANAFIDEHYARNVTEPIRAGQYVMLSVSDTGCGMDRETAERAFEPFFTTKDVGKGTGLGLSQVYGFMRQSGGHVKIYSEIGRGTTVKLYLPRHTPAIEEDCVEPDTHLPADARGTETLLVVEDDANLRRLCTSFLRELSYEVLEAASGEDVRRVIASRKHIDLLFTDVVLPGGVNGRQIATEVLAAYPMIKVLFTTGYTRNAIVHQGRLDPGVNLIGKPYSFASLSGRIRSLLDEIAPREIQAR
jgi:signal transduction histidine kinase/CheY-like chemotaxis protein